MSRLLVLATLLAWAGASLLLSRLRWFARPSLASRVRPYTLGTGRLTTTAAAESTTRALVAVAAPLAQSLGDRLASLAGVQESLAVRLRRLHRAETPTDFRVRQSLTAGIALLAGAVISAALGLPPALVALCVLGAPVLTALVIEQRLSDASARHQRHLFLELPVVAEQLGMLLAAGYSLSAGLRRLADRGSGVIGSDLRRVMRRIEHGAAPAMALREWSTLSGVDALDRLVAVLALNQETADLGRLVSEEARSIRRDVQRELLETIERRSQQVWIPVTVAALVPGAIFIAIPFIEALRAFGAT